MTTSNVCNSGIMHWSPERDGGRAACGNKRAHMSVTAETFRADPHKCKRCDKKLAEADARTERKVIGTIDLTPTWTAMVPLYIAALQDGSWQAQSAARDELMRMARIADNAKKAA